MLSAGLWFSRTSVGRCFNGKVAITAFYKHFSRLDKPFEIIDNGCFLCRRKNDMGNFQIESRF